VTGAPRLHLYGSNATLAVAIAYFEAEFEGAFDSALRDRLNLEIHEVEPFKRFEIGSYQVTALPANHDSRAGPLLYAITDGSKSVFYGVDTSAFPEETWEGLQDDRWRFDYVLLDHSYGTESGSGDHLSPRQFREHISRMRQMGVLKKGGRVFAHHISHSSNLTHPEMVKEGLKLGYEIPYDGLSLT